MNRAITALVLSSAVLLAGIASSQTYSYQCIALRDMGRYIDPAKAAKLPPTASDVKGAPPFLSLKDDKPYAAVAARGIKGTGVLRNIS
jgi:hypothetical protein